MNELGEVVKLVNRVKELESQVAILNQVNRMISSDNRVMRQNIDNTYLTAWSDGYCAHIAPTGDSHTVMSRDLESFHNIPLVDNVISINGRVK